MRVFWRHFESATRAIRQQEITFETEKKLGICQQKNLLQVGTENLSTHHPRF